MKKYKSQDKAVEVTYMNNKEEKTLKTFVWVSSKNLASRPELIVFLLFYRGSSDFIWKYVNVFLAGKAKGRGLAKLY